MTFLTWTFAEMRHKTTDQQGQRLTFECLFVSWLGGVDSADAEDFFFSRARDLGLNIRLLSSESSAELCILYSVTVAHP